MQQRDTEIARERERERMDRIEIEKSWRDRCPDKKNFKKGRWVKDILMCVCYVRVWGEKPRSLSN